MDLGPSPVSWTVVPRFNRVGSYIPESSTLVCLRKNRSLSEWKQGRLVFPDEKATLGFLSYVQEDAAFVHWQKWQGQSKRKCGYSIWSTNLVTGHLSKSFLFTLICEVSCVFIAISVFLVCIFRHDLQRAVNFSWSMWKQSSWWSSIVTNLPNYFLIHYSALRIKYQLNTCRVTELDVIRKCSERYKLK